MFKLTTLSKVSTPKKFDETVTALQVTHQGKWKISDDIEIDCYVTSNKRRFLSLRGTARAMGIVSNNSRALLRSLQSRWIEPYLSHQLQSWKYRASADKLERLEVIYGPAIIPFETILFIDLCKAYMLASKDGVLTEAGTRVAHNLLSIMTAFAKVGLDALVDEIMGYQNERNDSDLQKLLSKYICAEFLEWSKIFPDEFYEQLFRLRGWTGFGESGRKMPGVVGYFTNEIVYARLPHGVLEALKKKTPKSDAGNNLVRYHQSLSEDYGVKHLEKHLIAVIALMKSADSWDQFLYMLDRNYVKYGQSVMRFF